jgi:hypothetical protein
MAEKLPVIQLESWLWEEHMLYLSGSLGHLRRFLPPRHVLEVLQYICGWRTVGALHPSLNPSLKRRFLDFKSRKVVKSCTYLGHKFTGINMESRG